MKLTKKIYFPRIRKQTEKQKKLNKLRYKLQELTGWSYAEIYNLNENTLKKYIRYYYKQK